MNTVTGRRNPHCKGRLQRTRQERGWRSSGSWDWDFSWGEDETEEVVSAGVCKERRTVWIRLHSGVIRTYVMKGMVGSRRKGMKLLKIKWISSWTAEKVLFFCPPHPFFIQIHYSSCLQSFSPSSMSASSPQCPSSHERRESSLLLREESICE